MVRFFRASAGRLEFLLEALGNATIAANTQHLLVPLVRSDKDPKALETLISIAAKTESPAAPVAVRELTAARAKEPLLRLMQEQTTAAPPARTCTATVGVSSVGLTK